MQETMEKIQVRDKIQTGERIQSGRRNLPPLTALRAFESAAQHLSFTSAANELCITTSAVSHQIRNLEEFLDLKLFVRNHRILELTESGRKYYHGLNSVFDTITTVTKEVRNNAKVCQLVVHISLQTFALQWLIPRLPTFRARNNNIEVKIITSNKEVNFVRDGVDIYLGRGNARSPELKDQLIIDEQLVAVCAPALLDLQRINNGSQQNIHSINRSGSVPLSQIVADSRPELWQIWQKGTNSSLRLTDTAKLHVEHIYLAIKAAIAGLGIIVVPKCLIENELRQNLLTMICPDNVSTNDAYYSLCRVEHANTDKIREFNQWLQQEVSTLKKQA
jgi:LysR family glycine cleavage system transcriptional activator